MLECTSASALVDLKRGDGSEEAQWLLGDALDWSRLGKPRLKSIFSAWRPALR